MKGPSASLITFDRYPIGFPLCNAELTIHELKSLVSENIYTRLVSSIIYPRLLVQITSPHAPSTAHPVSQSEGRTGPSVRKVAKGTSHDFVAHLTRRTYTNLWEAITYTNTMDGQPRHNSVGRSFTLYTPNVTLPPPAQSALNQVTIWCIT